MVALHNVSMYTPPPFPAAVLIEIVLPLMERLPTGAGWLGSGYSGSGMKPIIETPPPFPPAVLLFVNVELTMLIARLNWSPAIAPPLASALLFVNVQLPTVNKPPDATAIAPPLPVIPPARLAVKVHPSNC